MKKRMALLLAAVLCLSLCACGSDGKDNKAGAVPDEDIWTSAEEVSAEKLWENIGGNAARAETYVGKSLKVTGTVIEIEKNNCYIMSHENENTTIKQFEDGGSFDCEFGIRVYLQAEELAELNVGDVITFAGVVDSTGDEEYGDGIEAIVLYFKNAITNG